MKARRAFSLIELLVVMGIASVLLTLGVTTSRSVVEKANATKCLSNLRQVGVAAHLFAAENGGKLPGTGHLRAEDGTSLSWTNTLAEYLGKGFIGRCPSVPKSRKAVTYGWNDRLTQPSGEGISPLASRAPSSTILLAETAETYTSEHLHLVGVRSFNQFRNAGVSVGQHGAGANYLFIDGHAEMLTANEVTARLRIPSSTNSTLIHP